MSVNQTLLKLSGCRDEQLRQLMIGFVFQMTIKGREAYKVGAGLENPDLLREVNELIHRVTDALSHLEEGNRALASELFAQQLEVPELTDAAFDRAVKLLELTLPDTVPTGV